MDPNDEGTMREEIMRAEAEAFRYSVLQPIGYCHWCETPVRGAALFCPGVECRDDWERDHRMRRISYGVR